MTLKKELPILESAKWRAKTGPLQLIVVLVSLWTSAMFVCIFCALFFDSHTPDDASKTLLVALVVCATLVACSIWLLKSPLFDYEWKTSKQRILIKGMLRKRFVNWSDITQAETRRVRMFMCQCYVLKTEKKTVVIPMHDALLGASIFYHLDKLDKSSGIELTKNMECFLNLRLENMPDEVTWQSLRPYTFKNALFKTISRVAPCIIIIAALVYTRHLNQALVAAIVTVVLYNYGFLRPLFVMGVAVNSEYIEVLEVIGIKVIALRIPWEDINLASWIKHELFLRNSGGGGMLIPWHSEDPSSTRLVLTVINHLHSVNKQVQVTVPEAIVQAWENR